MERSIYRYCLKKSILCCFDTDENGNFVSEVGVRSTDSRPRQYISSLISINQHMSSTVTNNSDAVKDNFVTNNNSNNGGRTKDTKSKTKCRRYY